MRLRHKEMERGSEELMELLARESTEREVRRQTEVGKGPDKEAPVRLTATTDGGRVELSQVIPVHLQGLVSAEDQEDSEPEGSNRECFASRRKEPS